MGALVCDSLATETSVKHCSVSALSGGEEGSSSTWLHQLIHHHIISSPYFYCYV